MDELESRMQRVLDAARQGMAPSAADIERSRRLLLAATAGLAVSVGTSAAAASAGAAGATGAASAATASKATGIFAAVSSLSLGTKVVTALAVTASLGTAGVWATQSQPTAQRTATPITAPAKGPVLAAPVAAPHIEPLAPEPQPAPEPAAAPIVMRKPVAPTAEPTITADPLSAELALIERARQALRNGNPQQALTALAEHRARFEGGVMTQERTALRALALCSLGDPRGNQEAQRFLEQNPGSPLVTHLRTRCR